MTDWREQASCQDYDPDLWFPKHYDSAAAEKAKAICAGCPVKPQCKSEYLWERDGIFFGTTPDERKKVRRLYRLELRAKGAA